MIRAIKEHVTIQAGGHVELAHPELPEGAKAEVVVMVMDQLEEAPPLASFAGRGKGCFSSAEQMDAFLRVERDQWES